MPGRVSRGLMIAVVLGFVSPAGGCGNSDSGTEVKVDRGKDEKLQNAMGNYMNKQSQPNAKK